MAPAGALLWRSLRIYQVYGANTEVGKTIITTALCNATKNVFKDGATNYLKPVSTGPENEADARHISRYAPEVNQATLHQYDLAVSPHVAALGKSIPSDTELLKSIYAHASKTAAKGAGWLFIETAGGVHSPGPSGKPQAELYKALRCPVILIGDSKLGGISLTISAYESLKIRGYDVEAVMLFQEDQYKNSDYLTAYFRENHDVPVYAVPHPPSRADEPDLDLQAIHKYYRELGQSPLLKSALTHLEAQHQTRLLKLGSMSALAHSKIWYPFTQQKLTNPDTITAIDSACGDHFQTLIPTSQRDRSEDTQTAVLQSSFDGSASWWTQGLGHASTPLTLAAAYAAGRYGHVMFADCIHAPALRLATALLDGMQNPRLTRVFYSDDGSTGVEVALKMALRAARMRYGWDISRTKRLGVIGLKGGYHGDTIGAMDCANPNDFNKEVEWYEGRGLWFDTPNILCKGGKWTIDMPEGMGESKTFEKLTDIFDIEIREARGDHEHYEGLIEKSLISHLKKGRKFGAVLIEPVVLGAGGMMLVDPLFQRALVNVVRRSSELFSTLSPNDSPNRETTSGLQDWTGLPVIFDEVFTGLYRLGRFTSSSFLKLHADISVHAKLLTGGLVPLCTTLASESCHVAVESVAQMEKMEREGDWDWAKKDGWTNGVNAASSSHQDLWSIWSKEFINWLSHQQSVEGAWALGSVLAIHMRTSDGGGYTSTVAQQLRDRLRHDASGGEDGPCNVHSRVLGNVIYFMGSQTSKKAVVRSIEKLIQEAL
ncbi:hypothetical protein TruAng_004854 [Truncatella angustata]|nr:hypothetical protein TruAng_004854 [Truncatella angustata]